MIGDDNSDLLKNNIRDEKKTTRYNGMELTSQTILDVISTSDTSKVLKSSTFDPATSDHQLVYAVIQLQRNREKPKIRTVRNYKNMDIESIKTTLDTTPWWICNVFEVNTCGKQLGVAIQRCCK